MSAREVLHTRIGEMDDMLACRAIASGAKAKSVVADDEEAIPMYLK